jgi:hypothetical protein
VVRSQPRQNSSKDSVSEIPVTHTKKGLVEQLKVKAEFKPQYRIKIKKYWVQDL